MKITLCGSARFEKQFKEWNKRLTLQGHVVYSLAVYPSDETEKSWYSSEQKLILDDIHKRKIDNSDAILVVDIDGYVGDSTLSEINYAESTNKRVLYLSRLFDGECQLKAENEALKSRDKYIGCLGCWQQFLATDEGRKELVEHIMICLSHPFNKSLEFIIGEMADGVGDRIDKLEAENADLHDLLKRAENRQIALLAKLNGETK